MRSQGEKGGGEKRVVTAKYRVGGALKEAGKRVSPEGVRKVAFYKRRCNVVKTTTDREGKYWRRGIRERETKRFIRRDVISRRGEKNRTGKQEPSPNEGMSQNKSTVWDWER